MTGESPHPTGGPPRQGLLDTNVLVLRRWVDPAELPDEMAISAITLAELSAGPYQVRPNGEQDVYDEHEERARRTEALQRAESEFDPVPFDAEAARIYGRVTAAVVAAGRKPRRRIADLMIAATAISEDSPPLHHEPRRLRGAGEAHSRRSRHPPAVSPREEARPAVSSAGVPAACPAAGRVAVGLVRGHPMWRWTLSMVEGPGSAAATHGPGSDGSMTPASSQP